MQKVDDTCLDEWVDIPGYEHLYKINKYGEIFSYKSKRQLKPYLGKVKLSKDSVRKVVDINELLAEIYPEDDVTTFFIRGDLTSIEDMFQHEDECVWIDITGFEGLYQMNATQSIRSLPRLIHVSEGRYIKFLGRAVKPKLTENGQPYVTLMNNDFEQVDILIEDLIKLLKN